MNIIEAIYKRRAVTHFDASHKLTAIEARKLLEATIQAPTSFNIQHWRIISICDQKLRARVRTEFGNDQAQMTDASLLALADRHCEPSAVSASCIIAADSPRKG